MKKTVILLLILTCSITGLSQVQSAFYENKNTLQYHAKIKTSLSKSIPVKKMQSFDVARLFKEDAQNEEKQDVPFRFGYGFDVDYTLKDGVWETQDDNNIWSLKITSEGAYSLNFIFEELFLSEGAELYIFSADGSMVYGPVTDEQNISGQNFLSDIIAGDEVVIQLIESVSSTEKSFLRISKVIHGYKNMFTSLTDDGNITQSLGASASCNNDVACYSAWSNESNAVALVLLSSGTEWCTGSVLNNTSQNYKPYFLSAFHCIDSDNNGVLSATEKNNAQNWAFRFNYKKSTCSGSTVTSYITYNNANFRAAWVNTDFLLMELTGAPVANLYFLGWDKTGNNPTSGTCIHHPKGDVMKISFDNNTITSNTSSITWQGSSFISPVNTHWVVGFDNGTIEKGSSGSPLFNQNKLVVGQLHGSPGSINGCAPITGYYGQFHKSWTGGGTDATRLSNWLDPTNTGASTLNTIKYPAISGASQMCAGTSATFTVSNPPANYTWNKSSNLTLVSTSGNTATFSASTGSSGYYGWVGIRVGNIDILKYNVWIGEPSIPYVYSTERIHYNGTYAFTAAHTGTNTPSSCKWRITGALLPSPVLFTSIFPEGSYTFSNAPMPPEPAVTHYVRVAVNTSCGWSEESLPQQFTVQKGPLEIPILYSAAYPNPAGNELIIDREEKGSEITTSTAIGGQSAKASNATVKVLLYSHSTTKLVYSKDFSASAEQIRIDTSKLPNGVYYLNMIANNEKIKEQTIIVNH